MQEIGQWFATQTPLLQGLMVFVGCYLIGCFTLGYYLVRWRAGTDLRQVGSGGVGATNVGRVLGRTGYIITLLADMPRASAWPCSRYAPMT